MTRLSVAEFRREMADALNRVAYGGERIILHRRGKDVAVLVSLEDLELLRKLEDAIDVKDALRAEAQASSEGSKPIPWEKVKSDLRQ